MSDAKVEESFKKAFQSELRAARTEGWNEGRNEGVGSIIDALRAKVERLEKEAADWKAKGCPNVARRFTIRAKPFKEALTFILEIEPAAQPLQGKEGKVE